MPKDTPESTSGEEKQATHQEHDGPLFDRLIPILFVQDLDAERTFYVELGFSVSYQGPEFPDFIALAHGPIEFGVERKPDFDAGTPERTLTWQLGVTDIETAKRRLASAGVAFREEWVTPREDWKYRVLHAQTPNGYHLMLEGAAEADG